MSDLIRSMTGYGRSEAVVNGRLISAEIRSVNHRYFEFSARVPRRYGFLEEKLKSYLQTVIGRGKVEVAVSLEQPQNQPVHVKVDHSLADGYLCNSRIGTEVFFERRRFCAILVKISRCTNSGA